MNGAPRQRKLFYGWPLLGVGFLIYGLGIGPGYYSWGFLAPEVMGELGLSREQVGSIFGTFTLTFALTGPLAALAIRHLGIRATTTLGALIAALGFALVSRADSIVELYLCYSLLGGIGIGLSTGFPTTTLAVNWFRRYRATAMAVILLGAAVVGGLVNPIDAWILGLWDWRAAWLVVGAISVSVAALALLFIRNRPEDVDQLPDGAAVLEDEEPGDNAVGSSMAPRWTAIQAIRTPQFAIATLAGMANVVPWRVITAHGRLHFEDLGFAATATAAILGVRVGVSAFGRVSGSLGDILSATRVMAVALVINGAGLAMLVVADTAGVAYLSVVLMGVGYGAGYISEPVVFANFFGRHAFVGTSGLRVVLIGIAGYFAPTLAGAAADRTGTYGVAITVLAIGCVAGAAAIFLCTTPARSAQTQARNAASTAAG
ncbi:MAG: MFS transporter [Acidobacteriota bacterium]|nr:MFS transporter [Acidobacteriota bacterium]